MVPLGSKYSTFGETLVKVSSRNFMTITPWYHDQGRIQDFHRGGVDPFWGGGFGLQHGHFSVKMYAKMKELGPVGEASTGTPPPRSAYEDSDILVP